MEKIKEFIAENRLAILIGLCLLLLICWLHHDANRNKPVYNDTDTNVADLEKRIQSVEQRIDGMSKRIEVAEKAVESVGRGISTSAGLTYQIIEGTGRAEKRLESAIQRSERIQSLISDIEKSDRERTKNP